jgi:hypothetical protein
MCRDLDAWALQQAIRLLFREVGVADTMRFIGQFITPSGDYTRDRHTLLGDPSVEELFAEARRREVLRQSGGNGDTERPLTEITDQAMSLLRRELGVANLLRFLRHFRSGTGNYTEDREDIPLEEILAEARRLQAKGLDRDDHTI